MSIVIREKRTDDVRRIVEIAKGLPEWFTSEGVENIKKDSERLPGFVAEVNNSVRGFVLIDERECCVEIAWMAVEKEYHGKGIGSMLLRRVEKYACTVGKPLITVKTYGDNDYEPYRKTMEFYRKWGFRVYEIIENYPHFEGQPAAILIKLLDCRDRV